MMTVVIVVVFSIFFGLSHVVYMHLAGYYE